MSELQSREDRFSSRDIWPASAAKMRQPVQLISSITYTWINQHTQFGGTTEGYILHQSS